MEDSIGAFWEQEGKKGNQYFTGEVEGRRYILFLNRYKQKGDKQPTFRVYKAKEYKKTESRDRDWNGPIVDEYPKEEDIALKDIPF